DSSPLPMFATEGRAHVVRYVNMAFRRFLGRSEGAIVGSPLRGPVRDTDNSQAEQDDAMALLDLVYFTGKPEFAVDLARVFGDASSVPVPCSVWPILGKDQRPVGLLVQVAP